MIKDHFTSRFGQEGCLIEADWSMLEVVGFAFLTQDITLINDIKSGIDIHTNMYAKCHGIDYKNVTKDQRSGIKACTFHVIYGGGAKSMASRMDLEEDFCLRFIEAFYARYPMAKRWQDNLVSSVESSKTINGKATLGGSAQHTGTYKSITGRKYVFETMDSPSFLQRKGQLTSFNPPEIKNYPVQGLCTADIHLSAIGLLFREAIKHRDKFLLINTVHDSVIIDCHKKDIEFVASLVKTTMESVKQLMFDKFKLDINVPMKVELKIGDSWGEMVSLEKYSFIATSNL